MFYSARTALFGLLLCQTSVFALSQAPLPKVLPVIPFAWKSVALSEDQKSQVGNAVKEVRNRDYCLLEAVIVIGYADSKEGTEKETVLLSEKRADYVRNLLQSYGVPDKVIFSEGKGSSNFASPSNEKVGHARVELDFIGIGANSRGDASCPPLDSGSGFRTR